MTTLFTFCDINDFSSLDRDIASMDPFSLDWIDFLSSLSSFELERALEHPNFFPHPIIDRYLDRVDLDTFNVLLNSDKFITTVLTLDRLLDRRDLPRIDLVLKSSKFIIPTKEKVATLFVKHTRHPSILIPLIRDRRFDLGLVEVRLFKRWVDRNERDVIEALIERDTELVERFME